MADVPTEADKWTSLLNGWMIVAVVAIVAVAAVGITALATQDSANRRATSTTKVSASTSTTAAVTTTLNPTTTAAPVATTLAGPACSASALFAVAAAHGSSVSPTFVSPTGKGSPAANCNAGWAVLTNFTVQAGSGNGIAVYQLVNNSWQFVQFGDDSGQGSNVCSQYPPAAVQALGSDLC
jgi:hypothetical protein